MKHLILIFFLGACTLLPDTVPPDGFGLQPVTDCEIFADEARMNCLRQYAVNIEDNIPTVPTRYDPAADIMKGLP